MTTLWLIPLALIAGFAGGIAFVHLRRELEQAFDIPIGTPADSDTYSAADNTEDSYERN